MREIRILKELKHENIVNLIEVFRWKGKIFLVFDYVPHTILEELENNPRGLQPMEIKKYMWQLIRATDFIHQHSAIHRDIKPENLLISKHGVLKICDFGFARQLCGSEGPFTDYVSTRWYRAPELLVGDAKYSRAIDVWAIGCLLAELWTGQALFPGETDLHTLQLILNILGGGLTEKQRSCLGINPIYQGMNLDAIIKQSEDKGIIEAKLPNMDEDTLDFLKKCLAVDPEKRLDCAGLLRHKYFEGFAESFIIELRDMSMKDVQDLILRGKSLQKMAAKSNSSSTTGSSNSAGNIFAINNKESSSGAEKMTLQTIGEDGREGSAVIGGGTNMKKIKEIEENKDENSENSEKKDESPIIRIIDPVSSHSPSRIPTVDFSKPSGSKPLSKVTLTFAKPKANIPTTSDYSSSNYFIESLNVL